MISDEQLAMLEHDAIAAGRYFDDFFRAPDPATVLELVRELREAKNFRVRLEETLGYWAQQGALDPQYMLLRHMNELMEEWSK